MEQENNGMDLPGGRRLTWSRDFDGKCRYYVDNWYILSINDRNDLVNLQAICNMDLKLREKEN